MPQPSVECAILRTQIRSRKHQHCPPEQRAPRALASQAKNKTKIILQPLDLLSIAIEIRLWAKILEPLELAHRIRHVAHTKQLVHPVRHPGDSPLVAESLEGVVAVVGTHTGLTHAAEGRLGD